jgi:hypothetical protein
MAMAAFQPDDVLALNGQPTRMAATPAMMARHSMAATQPDDDVLGLNRPSIIAPHDAHMAAALTTPIMAAPQPLDLSPLMARGSAPDVSTGMAAPKVNSPGSIEGQRLHNEDRLMADYQKDANPYGSANNHPGFFGKVLHGLSVATGGPARRQFEEEGGINRRGQRVEGLEGRIQDLSKLESEENMQNSQAGELGARTHLTQEQAEELPNKEKSEEDLQKAQTDKLQHPAEEWQPVTGWQGPNNEPMEYSKTTGAYRPAPGGAGASLQKPPQDKATNPQEQAFQGYIAQGMTPMQAWEKIREKPAAEGANEGTWTLAEDANGKPVLFNSKTGLEKDAPTGLAKTGTHAKQEAANAPVEGAMGYANDYMKRGAFTGSGDEALQEKFFELAKPSTGFRMSQPQIDMLQNSRSWMNSMSAHLRHATVGTWFSPEQRAQIVDTMNQLANAKKAATSGGNPQTGSSPTSGIQSFTVGSTTYHIPADKVAEFKKDHPDAR